MSVFQLLVADTSSDPDRRGIRAFSYDDENRHPSHPLSMGGVAWTRDLGDPHGTEYLVEIEAVEKDGGRCRSGFPTCALAILSSRSPVLRLRRTAPCRLQRVSNPSRARRGQTPEGLVASAEGSASRSPIQTGVARTGRSLFLACSSNPISAKENSL